MNIGLLLLVLPLAGAVLMGVLKVLRAIGTVLWWISRGIQQLAQGLVGGDWRAHATVVVFIGLGVGLWTNTIGPGAAQTLPEAEPVLSLSVIGPVTVAHLVGGAAGGGIAYAMHSGMKTILWIIRRKSWRT